MQRRVSVDVGGLQVAAGVQEQLGDVSAAGERRPVEADVLFLRGPARRNGDTLVLEWICQVLELYWNYFIYTAEFPPSLPTLVEIPQYFFQRRHMLVNITLKKSTHFINRLLLLDMRLPPSIHLL